MAREQLAENNKYKRLYSREKEQLRDDNNISQSYMYGFHSPYFNAKW